MNVRVQTLLDASFLDQLRRPRLVRQATLQRASDIDKLAGDLGIGALGAAVGGVTQPHMPDKSGFPSAVRGAGADRLGLPSGVRGTPGVG